MVTVECLRQEVVSGGRTYPIYVGFIKAEELHRVAEAPAFTKSTAHQSIAGNLLKEPVEDWQRPVNHVRVRTIADTFNNTGELMPNPVLLAANDLSGLKVQLEQKLLGPSKLPAGVTVIEIPEPIKDDDPRPLWILDGQHRIGGLAQSLQKSNHLPVVLLLDDDQHSYKPYLLAELFAQVTTKAEPLDPLHHSWLTYAFALQPFEKTPSGAETDRRRSFATAVALCHTQHLGGKANPFFNRVAFNHFVTPPPSGTHGGFSYDCVSLPNLVEKYYYKPGGKLDPADVATEIARAYDALYPLVSNPSDSVFFGGKKAQSIMQDSFVIGVLRRLRSLGTVADWDKFLRGLRFHETDWNFDQWTTQGGLSGPSSTASRAAAVAVIGECFTSGALPGTVVDIASCLQGDEAQVQIQVSALTPTGRPAKAGRQTLILKSGDKKPLTLSGKPHVRIVGNSSNVGKCVVWDAKTTPTAIAGLTQGIVVDATKLPWEWRVEMRCYGGSKSEATVTLK